MSWWDDIISVVSDVADVAGKILPLVLDATGVETDDFDDSNSYALGQVLFVPGRLISLRASGVWALNAAGEEALIMMTIAGSGSATCLPIPVPGSGMARLDPS